MDNSAVKPFSEDYRVILSRYNEIGLKAAGYKATLEKNLIAHIKSICKREKLSLQSVLHLQERLLFFFPADQIAKAVTVFRFIIGLTSISPAITMERDLEKITQRLIDFAGRYLKSKDTFWIHFKSITHLNKRFEDIEQELVRKVAQSLQTKGIDVVYRKQKMKKEIFIEVREKGAYLYTQKISTLWGGFPLESYRALISEWLGNPEEELAAQLLIRRGSILLPIIWLDQEKQGNTTNNQIEVQIRKGLNRIARYYAEPIQTVWFSLGMLHEIFKDHLTDTDNPCAYCIYSRFKVYERLITRTLNQSPYLYFNHPIIPRGIITTLPSDAKNLFYYLESFNFLHLEPLVTFPPRGLQQLLTLLQRPVDSFYDLVQETAGDEGESEYSVITGLNTTAYVPMKNLQKQSNLSQSSPLLEKENIAHCPCITQCTLYKVKVGLENRNIQYPSIESLQQFFSNPSISSAIDNLIDHQQTEFISGEIIPTALQSSQIGNESLEVISPALWDDPRPILERIGVDRIIELLGEDRIKDALKQRQKSISDENARNKE